ncbi:MAG: DUF6345 domain-containing protein [Thermoplasmata archaeon]
MGTKWRVFGIGIVLFALFWCSVAQMPTAKAGADNDNTTEVWVDWVKQYGGTQAIGADKDGQGFYNKMLDPYGWTGKGCYGNNNAKPDHFAKWVGHDPDADVNADIAYFAGHGATLNGQPRIVFNVAASGGDKDKDVEPDEDFWGYTDLEWITFSACDVLGPDANTAIASWGDNILYRGLHVINGFKGTANNYKYWSEDGKGSPRGAVYAGYLHGAQWLRGAGQSWYNTTIDDGVLARFYQSPNPTCIYGASLYACLEYYVDGTLVGTDYYWWEDVEQPWRDPISKTQGNIRWYVYVQYYSWLADWPHDYSYNP